MNSPRDEASLIGLTLRLRESLRRDLEETAKERGVSLNQQITDCLEHDRDRRGLLPEVLTTAFTAKTAAIVLMLARVMEDAGFLHLHHTRRSHYAEDNHWIEDASARAEAFDAAIAVLTAFPPWVPKNRTHGIQVAREMVRAIRRRPRNPKKLSPSIVNDVRTLLGSVAGRLTDPRPTLLPRRNRTVTAVSVTIADAVFALIQAKPNTPSRQEIANVISTHLKSLTDKEGAAEGSAEVSPPAANQLGDGEK